MRAREVDLFYGNDVVHGLPHGENRTSGYTASNMSRFQVNLAGTHLVSGSFLANLGNTRRSGLSFVNPAEATTNRKTYLYMSTIRDQIYLGPGALVDIGFADSRGVTRELPQGLDTFQITPFGNRGNYFLGIDRHFYRQQWVANLDCIEL